MPRLHLSKTRYLAGLQCPRRLWLLAHAPEEASPGDAAKAAILEMGHRIGRRAHGLFPGGVLVEEGARRHEDALAETRALVDDPSVPAVLEGVFEHAGVRVHVDALERLGSGAFGLREVKASAEVKSHHLHDVAVQRFVLEGAGLRVPSAQLVHLDRSYVRGPTGVEVARLFRREELADAIGEASAAVPGRVAELHAVLASEREPEVEPGRRCHAPYTCELWERCTAGRPDDWVYRLPRAGARFERLRELGVERLGEIPDDFPLSALQARVREAHRSGETFVSTELAAALASLGPPALYLDFEALFPAEPLHAGTRPFQCIPFQWSLHRLEADGTAGHREFLAEGRLDPRRAVAERLLEAAGGGEEPVLVWSPFEARVLDELGEALPDLAPALGALRARLRDLCELTRSHVYAPAFRGSFSIKAVAPALAPGFGWKDLADATGIAEGASAAAAFERIAAGEGGGPEQEARVRAALSAYCRRDTEALMAVHRALRGLSRRA
jgi:hypothetical protein